MPPRIRAQSERTQDGRVRLLIMLSSPGVACLARLTAFRVLVRFRSRRLGLGASEKDPLLQSTFNRLWVGEAKNSTGSAHRIGREDYGLHSATWLW